MTDMLESYSISCKKKKDYELKFKVAKGVKVTFKQVGEVNEVHLNYDTTAGKGDFKKNYTVKGSLKLQFYQYPAVGAGKDAPPPPVGPDPNILILP